MIVQSKLHQLYIYLGDLTPGLTRNLILNSVITNTYFVGNKKINGPFVYIDWHDFKTCIDSNIVKIIEKNPYKICDFKPFHVFWFQNYLGVKFEYYIICDLDLLISPELNNYKLASKTFVGMKNYAHFRMFRNCNYELLPPKYVMTDKNCAFDEREFYNFLLCCGFNQVKPKAVDVNIYSYDDDGSFFELTRHSLFYNSQTIDYIHIQKRIWPFILRNTRYYLNGKYFSTRKVKRFFIFKYKYIVEILIKRFFDKLYKESI